MDSWPPAIIRSASPQAMACAARCNAFKPEPHTLLIVIAEVVAGNPALIAAWRAGFCPAPAVSTWPINTSLTSSPAMPVFSINARITKAPKSVA